MPPSDFANADIESVVDQLTLAEAISLISGVGFWRTAAVPRLGIPAIKVSKFGLRYPTCADPHTIGIRWSEWDTRKFFFHGYTRQMSSGMLGVMLVIKNGSD